MLRTRSRTLRATWRQSFLARSTFLGGTYLADQKVAPAVKGRPPGMGRKEVGLRFCQLRGFCCACRGSLGQPWNGAVDSGRGPGPEPVRREACRGLWPAVPEAHSCVLCVCVCGINADLFFLIPLIFFLFFYCCSSTDVSISPPHHSPFPSHPHLPPRSTFLQLGISQAVTGGLIKSMTSDCSQILRENAKSPLSQRASKAIYLSSQALF